VGLEAAEIDLAEARHTIILRLGMVIICKVVAGILGDWRRRGENGWWRDFDLALNTDLPGGIVVCGGSFISNSGLVVRSELVHLLETTFSGYKTSPVRVQQQILLSPKDRRNQS
jgi:hypothetical protein